MTRQIRPAISVVIPAYRARNFLKDSLASVAAQDYPELEVLVIDDASPEPIDDILEEYSRIGNAPPLRLIRHEKNQGLGASRNTGIREAKGEYIAFLDHDDLWASDHVSNIIAAIRENDADLAFCSVMQFHENPEDGHGIWGPPGDEIDSTLPLRLFKTNFITPSAVIARRRLLEELGGFSTDPRVHMCEDLDLWLRALHAGARIAYAPKLTVFYRKHDSAATARQGYMAFQSAYVRELHAGNVRAPWFEKKSVVAKNWWAAWMSFLKVDERRWDVLGHAMWQGLPVPWEIARGMVHTFRYLSRRNNPPHDQPTVKS